MPFPLRAPRLDCPMCATRTETAATKRATCAAPAIFFAGSYATTLGTDVTSLKPDDWCPLCFHFAEADHVYRSSSSCRLGLFGFPSSASRFQMTSSCGRSTTRRIRRFVTSGHCSIVFFAKCIFIRFGHPRLTHEVMRLSHAPHRKTMA